jgi:hypothetical protein
VGISVERGIGKVIYRIGVRGMGKVVLWIFNIHKNDFMAGEGKLMVVKCYVKNEIPI